MNQVNNKTIIELGSRNISWFVGGSQVNYLPMPKAEARDKSRYFDRPRVNSERWLAKTQWISMLLSTYYLFVYRADFFEDERIKESLSYVADKEGS